MSEELKDPRVEIQSQTQSEFWHPERGAIDLGSLATRIVLGYHRAAGIVATARRNTAGERLENMDHKNALYHDLGTKYATGGQYKLGKRDISETADPDDWSFPDGRGSPKSAYPNGPNPRSIPEKIRTSHMERQRHKLGVVRKQRENYEKAFHIFETQDPRFRKIGTPTLEIRPSTPFDTSSNMARLAGRARRTGLHFNYYKHDALSPEERRALLNLSKANRPPHTQQPLESRGQEKHRKSEEKAVRSVRRQVEQPILSRWRNWRRERAIQAIKRHHRNAERHATIIREIKDRP